MAKKALLVGVNYTSIPEVKLAGCIDDIVNISEVLQDSYDYDIKDITMLRDDIKKPSTMPTRSNILTNLSNLVKQSANLSEIWFHYSGHGSQIAAGPNSDELDKLDEVLVPIDFQKSGFIIDNEIFNIIKNVKCKMILVFDCCHSGSICDLQWSFVYTNNSLMKSLNSNKSITNPNIFCFSGCKDSQTGVDAYSIEQAQSVGAFTDAFIHCLRANRMNVDVLKLYTDICVYIKSEGFTQTPILSCSAVTPNYIFVKTNSNPVSKNTLPILTNTMTVDNIPDTSTTASKAPTKDIPQDLVESIPLPAPVPVPVPVPAPVPLPVPVPLPAPVPVPAPLPLPLPLPPVRATVTKMAQITQTPYQPLPVQTSQPNMLVMGSKKPVKKSSMGNMMGRL